MSTRFDHVFIITYGRSGSTLLMGLLNSIDGYVIRGENSNLLVALFRSVQRIWHAKHHHGGDQANNPTDPWWGVNELNVPKYLKDLATLIDTQLIGNIKEKPRVLGFKEIRYPWLCDEKMLSKYLTFIKRTFPNCAFLFNFRDLNQVFRSGWWMEMGDDQKSRTKDLFAQFEVESRHYAADNPSFCFEINYSDVANITKRVELLFEFLGEPFDREKVEQTIATPHSFNNRTPNPKADIS